MRFEFDVEGDSYVGYWVTVTAGSRLSVADMALLRTVAELFKIPGQTIQWKVNQLKGIVTENAAMTDLNVQFFSPIAYSKSDSKFVNTFA
ncbi:hypothetical protein AX14_014182 [Amanita brunnescens Koide BX004]|nr:hypothetical protein AX14_014182 [Amanita brunnescens Koide BX004]